MDLSKVTLNLFDVLGYLLPGYILLLGFSIVEASASGTGVLSLSNLRVNVITFSIAAYFLGHVAHYATSVLQKIDDVFRSRKAKLRLFDKKSMKLNKDLEAYINSEVVKFFDIKLGEERTLLNNLEVFQFTDSYLATQKVIERDSLITREGFAKTSMGAFLLLTLQLLVALYYGGISVQIDLENKAVFNTATTLLTILFSSILSLIFWRRFVFFKRLKTDGIKFLFLGLLRDKSED